MYAPHSYDVQLPPLTVETINDDGVNNLRIAIIKAAADNYVDLVKGYLKHPVKDQTLDDYMHAEDRFFLGSWFKTLTMNKISGSYMIKALREKAKKEVEDENS